MSEATRDQDPNHSNNLNCEVIQANETSVRVVFRSEDAAYQAIADFWHVIDPSLSSQVRAATVLTSGDRTIIEPARLPQEKAKGTHIVIFIGNNQTLSQEAISYLTEKGISF